MFFRNLKWDIIGQRNYWFALSAAVIIAGIVALVAHHGLPLGLSFTGGSSIDVKFDKTVNESAVRTALLAIDPAQAQPSVRQTLVEFKASDLSVQLASKPGDKLPNDRALIATQVAVADPGPIYDALDKAGLKVDRGQSQITSVGPSLSKEYLNRSLAALVIALLLQLVYIAFRFGNQLRYGVVADLALVHDVLVMVGIYAIANRKADDAFLAALLTVIGYSVMDSIVIFDRIRENGRIMPDVPYSAMVNTSLLQTMTRSVNTLATVLITLFALYWFGGDTLKNFAFALLVGVTSGAYSSIFIASPILVMWKNAESRRRVDQRKLVVAREAVSEQSAKAKSAAQVTLPPKRIPPKVKRPSAPPPRYRRKRPQEIPAAGSAGSVGLFAGSQPRDDADEGAADPDPQQSASE